MFEQNETKNSAPEKWSFWRRQFASAMTIPQLAYDVIFGVVMPILCFIFDPIVFSGRGFIPLAQYRSLIYLFSAISIVTLVAWLLTHRAIKSGGGIIAGVLLSGAVCSFLIGVLILPLSLIGLMFIIGALGFTPFFTAFVYLRNGIRAMKSGESYVSHVSSLLSGALLAIALPYAASTVVNDIVSQSIYDLTKDDPQAVEKAIRRLKYVGWSGNMDRIVWSYSEERDQIRKQNLARAYKEITGNDVENRLAILLD